MQRTRDAQSEARSGSNGDTSNQAHESQQTQASSLTQSQKRSINAEPAEQSAAGTQRTQESNAKKNMPEGGSTAAKDAAKTEQQGSRKTNSKKAAFTGEEGAAFNLQDSTTLAGQCGVFSVSATTATADVTAGSADATGQSVSTQSTTGVVEQGTDAQVQTDSQSVQAVKGNDAELAAKVLQAVRQADAQSEPEFDLNGVATAAVTEMTATDGTASGTVTGDTDATQTVDAATAMQASLAARVGVRPAVKQGDSDSNQPAVTLIQSKDSGSAAGLKGDASKPDKDDTNSDGHSTSLSFGNAVIDLQTVQSAGTHTQSVSGDANALQGATVAQRAQSNDAAGTQTASGSADTTAHRGDAADSAMADRWQGVETAGMSGISAARLIQNMSGTEMRVGMHSSEFGEISIRTSVSQQQMQTQISVDHNELGNALSAHIPSMQAKMGSDYGLHATIEVNQGGTSFSNDGGRSQNQQQQASVRRIDSVDATAAIERDAISLSSVAYASSDSRLDIRA